MGITSTRTMAGAAGVIVAVALSIGVAAGQSGTASAPPRRARSHLRPGHHRPGHPRGRGAVALGLAARSDALNRQYHLGRYAPGGECADIPDWFRALTLRSDEMNRLNGLGPYARTPR